MKISPASLRLRASPFSHTADPQSEQLPNSGRSSPSSASAGHVPTDGQTVTTVAGFTGLFPMRYPLSHPRSLVGRVD
jgi:hypothetical protein